MNPFDDWRYRWSRVVRQRGRWFVVVDHEIRGGTLWPTLRTFRWWSPRDLIRIPLHRWWERKWW